MTLVWINGQLQAAHSGGVSALDQGLQLGLAVFDTLLLSEGRILFVDEHLARFERSARGAGLPWPPPFDPRAGPRALATALGWREGSLRWTYSAGAAGETPLLVTSARPLTIWPADGVRVCVSSHAKLAADPLERIKHTNRLRNVLARAAALAQGCDEALLPTEAGDLSEGTLSNLFVARDGLLLTPPLERGCLPGVTREHVLESVRRDPRVAGRRLDVREQRIEPADVRAADEVLLTNTSGRVLGALEVRGLRAGLPGSRGPLVAALRERMLELERAACSQPTAAQSTIHVSPTA
jgi:branched-subunit amino acid aminotransferase/4-amino-4-deoxychorismate lyase